MRLNLEKNIFGDLVGGRKSWEGEKEKTGTETTRMTNQQHDIWLASIF